MSRKVWIALACAGLLMVAAAAAGVAALILVPKYRAEHRLSEARRLASEGALDQSRRFYQEYLYNNDDDIAALEEYIEVCTAIIPDRRRSLLAAGRAYIRLAQSDADNPQRKVDAVDFYRRHQFWPEVEYTINLLFGPTQANLDDEMAYYHAVAVYEQRRLSSAISGLEAYLGLTGTRRGAPMRDAPLRLARAFREVGRRADAEAVFSGRLADHPEAAALPVLHGQFLVDTGQVDAAASALQAAPESERDSELYLLAAARLALLRGNADQAVELTRRLLEVAPEDPTAHITYALALNRDNEREKAIAHIEARTPAELADAPAYFLLLIEMKLEGLDFQGAEAARAAYMRAYPDQRFLDEYLRGRIAFAQGRNGQDFYETARAHFVRAVQLNPNLHRARYFLALTDFELGDRKSARTELQLYLSVNPDDGMARRLWNRFFAPAPSLVDLRFTGRRLQQDPNPVLEDLLETAQYLMRRGRDEDIALAQQLIDRAIAAVPRDARAYSLLAAFHLERDEIDLAERALARASESGLSDADFPLLRSSIQLARGETAEALATARENLASATFSDARSWALLFARLGHVKEADSLLQAFLAATATPGLLPDVLALRHSVMLRFGTLDEARAIFREAETSLTDHADHVETLNTIRLDFARALASAGPGNIPEAESVLADVAASDPNSDGLIVARARLGLARPLPDYTRAIAAVASISENSASYEDAQLLGAEIAYRQGNYEDVIQRAGAILEFSSENTAALYLLGEAQVALRRPQEARATFERVLELDPGDAAAMRALARTYAELDHTQLAESMVERYAAAGNRDLEELKAYLARGEVAVQDSEDSLRNRLAENPNDFAALAGLVRSLLSRGELEEGRAQLRGYLERNPNEPEPWILLGQALLDHGGPADLGEASTAFTRAQILVPDYGPALLGKIDVLFRQRQYPLALTMCRRYLENRPGDRAGLFRLATLLAQNPANHPEALEITGRLIESGPLPELYRMRAFLHLEQGEYEAAVSDIEALAPMDSTRTADDDLTLAEAYFGMSDSARARSSLADARRKIGPGQDRLRARADQVEQMLNGAGAVQ